MSNVPVATGVNHVRTVSPGVASCFTRISLIVNAWMTSRAVSVTITGKFEARRVHIDPSVTGDAEMLEDLVTAALNDAVAKANEESNQRMAAATAGMSLPPGMKLPF